MQRIVNTLIVDDHPITLDAYKMILAQVGATNNIKFNIADAIDCDSAYLKILNYNKNEVINLVLLDIRIPASKDKKILSGEDLGILLKKNYADIKIIVITSLTDNYLLRGIFKSINPEGLLVKNDITMSKLAIAIKNVIDNEKYYSKMIISLLRNHIACDISLDNIDYQILHHLSRGVKTKNLCQFIPLSISGIKKRKQQLKFKFNIGNNNDLGLVAIAKENGFI